MVLVERGTVDITSMKKFHPRSAAPWMMALGLLVLSGLPVEAHEDGARGAAPREAVPGRRVEPEQPRAVPQREEDEESWPPGTCPYTGREIELIV